jgi:hypothetical protein
MNTAVDIAAPGYDYVAGAGRLDAVAAANAVPVAQCTTDASCNDGNACNGGETCQRGVCTAGTPPNCDDGDPCTIDTCDAATGCQHAAVADPTSCSTLIPGGGPAKSDCYAVLAVQGAHARKNTKTLVCADGDPTCDMDGVCNNVCTLRVYLCINSPRLPPCPPPSQLQSLHFKSHPATFTVNTPGRLTGAQCGARQDVHLPVKLSKSGKKSTGELMLTGSATAPKGTKPQKDSDTYVLKCTPGCSP